MSALVELLDGAPDPVYVLDDRRKIVFCNQALANWVGAAAEHLIGRRVDYHSVPADREEHEATGPESGLCPPPAAFVGQDVMGHISTVAADGRLHHRRARFAPLGLADDGPDADCHGVVAFVAPRDLTAAELTKLSDSDAADGGDPSSDALHLAIRRFRHRQAQHYAINRLVGVSPLIQRARQQVAVASTSRANVTIVGPPGSGREHVARSIHYLADRDQTSDLLPLDCGLMTADTLRRSIDLLIADDSSESPGTLLLGEVDHLSHEHQIALTDRLTSADDSIRVVATAGHELGDLAAAGVFLAELACQLDTITIRLPPLASRIDDLPLLAQALLEEQNARGNRQVGSVATDAMDQLALYPWPGEVDELAEALATAYAQCQTADIQLPDLPAKFRHAADMMDRPRHEDEQIVLDEFLANIEMELISRALAQSGGNKARAARSLGMTRPRLYRRLVQLGLADVPEDDDQSSVDES